MQACHTAFAARCRPATQQQQQHAGWGGPQRLVVRQQQQHSCRGRQLHAACLVVARYDTRRAANNVAERSSRSATSSRSQQQRQLADAQGSGSGGIVLRRARALVSATKGRVSLTLALALLTRQQQLLGIHSKAIGARVLALAEVLGVPPADVAQLLLACGALLDVLPLRLRSASQALATALHLDQHAALGMLAADLNLLDTPPLAIKAFLDGVAVLLAGDQQQPQQAPSVEQQQAQQPQQQQQQHVCQLLYGMAARCPALLRVEAAALVVRYNRLGVLLGGLGPASLAALLTAEPRLLMPSSKTLAANYSSLRETLGLSPATLNRWIGAAPMLLLVPAAQARQRVQQLRTTLGHYSRLLQLLQQQEQRRRQGEAEDSDASSSEDSDAAEGADDSLFAADAFDAVLAADSSATHKAEAAGQQQQQQQQQRSGDSTADAASDHAGVRWVCAASEWQQLLTYISKDPRVLLLTPKEILGRVWVLGAELGHSTFVGSTISSSGDSGGSSTSGGYSSVAAALALAHPSYIAADAGLLFAWASDVRHLTGMTAAQARRLVVCPQVFLTLSPEDVLASLAALAAAFNCPQHGTSLALSDAAVAAIAAAEPMLLVQPPSATASALAALAAAVQDAALRRRLLAAVPALLLQGGGLAALLQQLAGRLTLSCAQLAVLLVQEPGFWPALVLRHTWPCYPPWQQQEGAGGAARARAAAAAAAAAVEQQVLPAAATAAATMAALVRCGLRPAAEMQAAAVLHPRLLLLGPAAALHLVELLSQRCARSARWQQQLAGGVLSPDQLGAALLRAKAWDARLAFLINAGWPSVVDLPEVLALSRSEFTQNFGPHGPNLAARQQQQQWQPAAARQQQQQLPEEQQVDSFVAALQARLGGGDGGGGSAAIDGSSNSSSGAVGAAGDALQQQQQQQQQQADAEAQQQQEQELRGLWDEGGEGELDDVADAVVSEAGISHAAAVQPSHQGLAQPQQHQEVEQQQQLATPPAGLQQQVQWVGGAEPSSSSSSRGLMPTRRQRLLDAILLSGLDVYGTWQGCMLQPAAVLMESSCCLARGPC